MSILAILAILAIFANGEVIITDKNFSATFASFHSMSASFGRPLPPKGVRGAAMKAIPDDGCEVIEGPPTRPKNM